ncbi:polyprenyl synthetase family protein [Halocatena salina]|uniref:Polyprenyl synthetase family protein n=1 Tax=Halocatena salina TaxID=2934340 RepID=A0A8U0A4H7_9EURY|nr:polyprenyl synthetase family protein [Halocatena salina]UPM43756.1 polyprenyl synthetase family protein [Halocatena salina]
MREVFEEWRPVVDREIERLLPRTIDEAYLSEFFGSARYEYDSNGLQRALSDPVWNLLDRGGKRWRAIVFLLLVEGFGEDPDEYLQYACIPEILHNGTIIVDDVEDEADMRRGDPALHHISGKDVALNAGNAMYFFPLKILTHNPADLSAERRLSAYEMLMHELNRTHLGQGMDIYWHNKQTIDITEAEYLEMCACKTGCLGRIVARLAAIVTGQDDATEQTVGEFAELMSVAFQIGDDILDIETSDEDGGAFGKAAGNDIREGKKTLMVIHAANNASPQEVARMENILWADENTTEEIETVVELLYETGSVDYAREKAQQLSNDARACLQQLDLDPNVADQLAAFTRFVIDRDV